MEESVCEGPTRPYLVRPREAARMIGISHAHLYNMMRAGEFPVPRVAVSQRLRCFRVSDIEAWVAQLAPAD